jgi:hypothetical protein
MMILILHSPESSIKSNPRKLNLSQIIPSPTPIICDLRLVLIHFRIRIWERRFTYHRTISTSGSETHDSKCTSEASHAYRSN